VSTMAFLAVGRTPSRLFAMVASLRS
jgi:hypothetical protein